MQREIGNNVHLGQTVSAFDSIGGVSSIDRTASNFDTAREKVKKLENLVDRGEYNAEVARYIPGTLIDKYKQLNSQHIPPTRIRKHLIFNFCWIKISILT